MSQLPRRSTGVAGLDYILGGGWPSGRLYLVIGNPGSGKTTLGMQFLLDGVARGERVLYITLSETKEEVAEVAQSHGWSLEGMDLYELTAAEQVLGLDREPSMFDPAEVEFRATSRSILDEVDRVAPTRVVFDSLSELALLAREPLAFRRELLMLKQTFIDKRATVLLLSDSTTPEADLQLQSLTHGVMNMEDLAPEYGGERRRLRIRKLRGSRFRGGHHDYRIGTGGLLVYPRLVASEHAGSAANEPLSSGEPSLDGLLGGGLPRGNSTLFMGPAGCGKSTLASQFAARALEKGESAALFLFDESSESFLRRADKLEIDLRAHLESGRLTIDVVNAAELSPGELSHHVRRAVEERGVTVVAIDSLNGYLHAMAEERLLTLHVHELLAYLNQAGVATMMTLAQHGLVGTMTSPADLTYVADTVVLMRYFESRGMVRRAISVVKNRAGAHENTIRELSLGPAGLRLSEPLRDFQGVLSGVPMFTGKPGQLLDEADDA